MALTQIQMRRGTAAAWTTANPVLLDGEPGLESDTRLLKFGNGSSVWSALPYAFQAALALVVTSSPATLTGSNVVLASGTFSQPLPTAAAGLLERIKNTGTGVITVTGTIDGGTNYILPPLAAADFYSDGTNWWVL